MLTTRINNKIFLIVLEVQYRISNIKKNQCQYELYSTESI